jgi:prepilin-type processing-associated H-X9-DG protein
MDYTADPVTGVFFCPSNSYHESESRGGGPTASYGVNWRGQSGYYTHGATPIIRRNRVAHPSAYAWFGDCNNRNRPYYYALIYQIGASYPFNAHMDGGNLMWIDGHVTHRSASMLSTWIWYWLRHDWVTCDSPFLRNCPPPSG